MAPRSELGPGTTPRSCAASVEASSSEDKVSMLESPLVDWAGSWLLRGQNGWDLFHEAEKSKE